MQILTIVYWIDKTIYLQTYSNQEAFNWKKAIEILSITIEIETFNHNSSISPNNKSSVKV